MILLNPLAILLHRATAWTYEFSGMYEQAIAELIETSRIQNLAPERITAFRHGYDIAGTKGYCRAWLELQRERIERGPINLFYLAQVCAFIGDNDRALACLEKSFEDHSLDVPALRYSPSFDDLRKDERYLEFLKKMRLETESRQWCCVGGKLKASFADTEGRFLDWSRERNKETSKKALYKRSSVDSLNYFSTLFHFRLTRM